jgi:hypothetical protein
MEVERGVFLATALSSLWLPPLQSPSTIDWNSEQYAAILKPISIEICNVFEIPKTNYKHLFRHERAKSRKQT